MDELSGEQMSAEQAHVLWIFQRRQREQRKMSSRINEQSFLRRQRRCMRRMGGGEKAEDMERAEGERDHNVILLRRMPEKGHRGIEEIGKRMFVVQQGQEKFYAALCAEKSRQISRRNAAGHGNGSRDETRRAR